MFRKPPMSVRVDGRKYRINPDFRIFAKLESDVHRDKLNIEQVLRAFYRNDIPDNVDAAVERLIWFYRGVAEQKEESGDKRTVQLGYDFEQDEDALYQSFARDYKIDLYTVNLHWWKFCQLCAGLSDDAPFRRLIYIRTVDTSKLPKEQRASVMKAREQCRLGFDAQQQPRTVEDYEAARIAELRKAYEEA